MKLVSGKQILKIRLTEDQRNYHPIIKYSYKTDFSIKSEHLYELKKLALKYKLSEKYLECVALFFSQLTEDQSIVRDKNIKRERRKIEMKLNPLEFQKMKTIVQRLEQFTDLAKIKFYFKDKNLDISEPVLLTAIYGILLRNINDIKKTIESGEHPSMQGTHYSPLVSEQLDTFFKDCWPESSDSTKRKFMISFYKLAGIKLSNNALTKRLTKHREKTRKVRGE